MEVEIKCETLQNLNCKLGLLSRSDGSVLLSQGATTVVAGCYGPVESKTQKVLIDKANVEVHYRPKAGLPGVGDRLYEAIIRNICETALVVSLYPRTSILVIVQEMQNSGALLSCAVNAACLALIDSGIDMRFFIASVTCVLDDMDMLSVCPSTDQLDNSKAVFVFVFDSTERRIIASHTTGLFSAVHYKDALNMCKEASVEIFDYYKNVMKQKYIS